MPSTKTTAVLTAITTGLHALEIIGDTAGGLLGLPAPTAAQVHAFLEGIVAVVNGFKNGVDGTLNTATITAELDKLRATIAGNDQGADGALDTKFHTNPIPQ